MRTIQRLTICIVFLALFSMLTASTVSAHSRRSNFSKISSVYRGISHDIGPIKITNFEINWHWTWIEMDVYDEKIPITIDILVNTFKRSDKTIYMFPGSPSNFNSSFFTPTNDNLAHFYRKKGYVVIGISPREENLPKDIDDADFTSDWGLEKHTKDIRKYVKIIQRIFRNRYELFGHSYGALYALDYAGKYDGKLEKITIVDLDIYEPDSEESVAQAGCYEAYRSLLENPDENARIYLDKSFQEMVELVAMGIEYPDMNSGESRDMLGLPGNFTLGGLLHFSMIYTGMLPGIVSHITGLPGDWGLVGNAAGYYGFAPNPLDDTYGLDYTDLQTTLEAAGKVKSGIIPVALHLDHAGASGFVEDTYQINWEGIDEDVVWVNTELGYGDKQAGVDMIRQKAQNRNVIFSIIPGFAHIDILWGSNLDEVWEDYLMQ